MGTLRNSVFLWRGRSLFLLLFCFAIGIASAQERTIKGKVTSAEEGPLPGVNIKLQGTLQGAVTDADGNYTITVPGPEAVLEFSYISYTPQTVTVGAQSTIDVVLAPAATALGEIVVIGYGTQKRQEVTSAVASVKSDDFNKGNVSTPEQLIQGKVSGLSITKAGGNPNEGYNIRLRGLSTVGMSTEPLIVIDGIIGGSLDNVDPNDVESINVLKDGSAAAIYGTRGSSGVIIVTTKRGRAGTAVVDYNGYVTMEAVAKTTDVMDASEWRALSDETGLGTDFGYSTDWFDEITQTAVSQTHNLSLSGGSDKTNYRASVNYRTGNGSIINTGYSQLNGRINLTQKAIKDKLTIDLNVGATDRKSKFGFPDAFRYASVYNPTAPVRSDDPAFEQYDGYFQQVLFDYYNPVQILEKDISDGKDKILNIAGKVAYEIMTGLSVDAFYSYQQDNRSRAQYYDKNSYWVGMDRNGLANINNDNSYSQLFETTARWNGNLMPSLAMSILGGYSYQDFYYEGSGMNGGDFLTDAFKYHNMSASQDFKNGIGTVSSYANSNKLIAFFGRVNLNYDNTYFLNASARYEGSSRFGEDTKWGMFPGIGGGIELTKFLNVSALDNLKVRVNYGVTGNQPRESYLSLLRLGPNTTQSFLYNGVYSPVYEPFSVANADLGWEKKGEFDAGIDFSLLGSKIYGSFDFYTRTTTDLIFQYEVPVPPNLDNQAWLNLGEIKSSGLELTVTWNVISNKDFTYSTTLTPSYSLENTLVSLSGTFNGAELNYGVRDLGGMGAPGQSAVPLVRAEEGKPIGQILSLVYDEIDEDGNLIFKDLSGPDGVPDGTVDALDRTITGNGLPDLIFGWANSFTYKNWDLNILFRGVFGHDLINSYRAFYEVPNMIGSYNLPKTAKDMRNPTTGTLLNNSSGVFSSIHVENASFFTLDNLALGYNFGLKQGGAFNKIRLYLAGNNLFYITKYKGVDPNPRYGDSEDNNNPLVPGVDRRNTWFRTRSFTFGANIVF
jgi:TonB-dependent starch-binding outer membrane protein SusC